MRYILLLLFVPIFALANAHQGASLVSKAEFISLKDSANGKIIQKLYKSDFLLTITAGGTDEANPNWVRVSIDDDFTGVLHKRDVIILDEKDYQVYLQTLIKQIIASLSASYQNALRADDPTLQALSQNILNSTFTPQSEIGKAFRAKRMLLKQLSQKSYQQALESAIALGFVNTAVLLLDEKGVSVAAQPKALDSTQGKSSVESSNYASQDSGQDSSQSHQDDLQNSPQDLPGDLLLRALLVPDPSAKIIAVLLQHGANPNAFYITSAHPSYALTIACALGRSDIVRLLVDSGASLSPESSPSPLIIAIASGDVELTRYLLNAGAKFPNHEYDMLATVLESFPDRDDKQLARELFALILDSGVQLDNALYTAAKNGHVDAVGVLLDKGAKSNGEKSCLLKQSPWHCSPLIAALESLLAKGSLESKSAESSNAHLTSYLTIVELLLKHGADREITNAQGQGIKAWVASYHSPLQTQIYALLDFAFQAVDSTSPKQPPESTATQSTSPTNQTQISAEQPE